MKHELVYLGNKYLRPDLELCSHLCGIWGLEHRTQREECAIERRVSCSYLRRSQTAITATASTNIQKWGRIHTSRLVCPSGRAVAPRAAQSLLPTLVYRLPLLRCVTKSYQNIRISKQTLSYFPYPRQQYYLLIYTHVLLLSHPPFCLSVKGTTQSIFYGVS